MRTGGEKEYKASSGSEKESKEEREKERERGVRAVFRMAQGQFTTSVLIKQKATPYTKLIREWLSYPHARSPLQKYFPPARPLRLRALFLSSPSSLPPSRAPHLSLTTSAYGPHSYFHFFLFFFILPTLSYSSLLLSSQHHSPSSSLQSQRYLRLYGRRSRFSLMSCQNSNSHGKQICRLKMQNEESAEKIAVEKKIGKIYVQ